MTESTPPANTPKIGVVGHSRAGKSTFLAVLKSAFERGGWPATVKNPNDSERPGMLTPVQYEEYLRRFVERGYFPPSTVVSELPDRVSFEVKRESGKGFDIDCFDPAGEVLEGNYDSESVEAKSLLAIQSSLRACGGILLLLDAEPRNPDLWLTTWERVQPGLDMMQRGKRGPRIAVCFAKADASLWQRRYRIRDALTWVSEDKKGRDQLRTRLVSRGLDVRWYFVSASGWSNGAPNVRTFVDWRQIRRTGTTQSHAARELTPDPAQPTDAERTDDVDGYRYMQNLSMFTDPLRLRSHAFADNPMTDQGPRELLPQGRPASRPAPRELAGVHVGYGRRDVVGTATIRPWNVLEPMLWLADDGVGGGA